MNIALQYGIIAIIFIIAIVYIVKRLCPSKNKQGSCAKGCGCSEVKPKK